MLVYREGATAVATRTEDGWTLRGERLVDDEAPAVVVLGHAMMVDRRTLDRPCGGGLASTLHAAGLDVSWFDSRGHGDSGPLASEGARWSYDGVVRGDVPALVRFGRSVAGGRPVVVLGHSLVGHAAMIAAGLCPDMTPDAIVAYAPNLWTPSLEPDPRVRVIKTAALRAWRAVTRANGYFDPEPFGIGKTPEAADYVEQFWSMWADDRLGGGGDDYEAALSRGRVEVLAFSSRNDRVFATTASVARFVALARNAPVEHVVLEGPDAPDHMGFVTDPRSETVWERTASWIRSRAGG